MFGYNWLHDTCVSMSDRLCNFNMIQCIGYSESSFLNEPMNHDTYLSLSLRHELVYKELHTYMSSYISSVSTCIKLLKFQIPN